MITLIDASVAIKWYVENEPLRFEALQVLDQIRNQPDRFAVPELFFNEMLSVLCRLSHHANETKEYVNELQDLGFIRLDNGRETLSTAVTLAKTFNLSGYDAIYAANAQLIGGIWLTADKKAHKKILSLKISRILE